MAGSSKEARRSLFQVAAGQHGFFTTRQAEEAGYRDNVHPYHVHNGDWVRMGRGIYRLAEFPDTGRPELIVALLWSRDRKGEIQGALSHMTALEVRGLAPAEPHMVHMTVPKGFRRNSHPPEGVVVHKNGLTDVDIEVIGGLRVTNMVKTAADLQKVGVPLDALEGADLTAGERELILARAERQGRPPADVRSTLPPYVKDRTAGRRAPARAHHPRPPGAHRPGDQWGGARAW